MAVEIIIEPDKYNFFIEQIKEIGVVNEIANSLAFAKTCDKRAHVKIWVE